MLNYSTNLNFTWFFDEKKRHTVAMCKTFSF